MWISRRAWTHLLRTIGELTATVQTQSLAIHSNTKGVNRMSVAMDDLTTAVAMIGDAISAEVAGLTKEITDLKMQGSSATVEDTAGIEAIVVRLGTLADQLKAATPVVASPPSASPAPGATQPAPADGTAPAVSSALSSSGS